MCLQEVETMLWEDELRGVLLPEECAASSDMTAAIVTELCTAASMQVHSCGGALTSRI